ncbi:MAG: IS1182 family transposase [Streptomycetaceae bacterium]|nr:IS1182 family transposase [Streptomycetaceae bacterium]
MLRPVDVPPVPEATAALAWQVHPRGTDEMRVRDALGPLFTDADFTTGPLTGMYSGLGQPGLSPALLLMVVILQFRHNLSDRQAVEAVADRISWKYALSRELSDPGFDHTVLSEFRARLAEESRADAVLDLMLARLKDAGLVRAGGRQRTDSSYVIACVRRLNRIETCGESLRAALEEIAAVSPGFVVPLLKAGWDERYGRKVETSRLLGRKNGSAQALAEQIGADGQELLDAIDADPVAAWMNELPKVACLRTVWDQQYDRLRTGRPRLKDVEDLPPAAARIHSPHDVDARYSTKTSPGDEPDLQWVGTKCHLSESCDPDVPNLITDVHTTPATDPDVSATTDIQDRLIGRDLAPGEHLMDAGYPSAEGFAASAKRGITLIAPVIAATGRNAKKGTFTPLDFTVDWENGQARCPAGAVSRSMRPDARGLVTFRFRVRDCRPCPLRAKCTRATDPDKARTITIHPEPVHEARLAAHRAQHGEAGEDRAKVYRLRAGAESTVSQAVRGPDLRHSRYRGLAKAHVQNVLTGMALNITRLGAHFTTGDQETDTEGMKRPCRPPTRVHQLCRDLGLTTKAAA